MQARFTLSLERVMYYSPGLTWRSSWLDKVQKAQKDENNFAGEV